MKPVNLLKLIINGLLITAILISCVKEEIDLEKISDRVKANPDLYLPMLKGSLTIEDMFKDKFEDSTLILKGDSIYLYLKKDSVYVMDIRDYIDIPDQGAKHYSLNSGPLPIPYFKDTTYVLGAQIEIFELEFPNNTRADSIFFNSGYLEMELTSNFDVQGALRIEIPGLEINNKSYDSLFYFERPTGEYHRIHSMSLSGSKIRIDNSDPGIGKILIYFTVIQEVHSGDVIQPNSFANIDVTFQQLNDFEVLFGCAGDTTISKDTIVDLDLGSLEGVTGTLSITNPKIHINYENSFGAPVRFNADIKGYFDNADSVIMKPGPRDVQYSTNWQIPVVKNRFTYSRESISNIDDFFVFPTPDQIGLSANVQVNPDGLDNINFLRGDSKFILGIEAEVPLELRANLDLRDTVPVELGSLSNDNKEDTLIIEYVRLHYKIKNDFPINFDASLILYDTITDIHLDTIDFYEDGNFIEAAPVDQYGVTILSEVEEKTGSQLLTRNEIESLFTDGVKGIIIAKISSYNPLPANANCVKILDYYKFDFKTYIESKILYEGKF